MATERKSGALASHQGQLGRFAVCAYLAALAVALAGCSASEVVQNLTPAAIDLPQPNYRRVVADNVKAVIPNVGSVGDLEISGVRLVDHLKGPAWLTCLKFRAHVNPVGGQSAPNSTATGDAVVAPLAPSSTTSGNPQYHAIFIQGDKI